MNYYVQSIEKYIINEWIRSFSSIEAPREVKFIVQSLSPKSVFELFNALEKRKQELLKTNNIACQFRVATGLWREWCLSNDEKELDQKMDEYGAIRNGTPPERMWIDEEDRLTWYRNRTAHDENAKELVVVLVGFNHATDKGGLSDFHRVDEERIWDFLEKSFDPWISSLNSTLKLHLDSEESERINIYLQEIYSLRPLSLSKISDFLNHIEATYKSFDNFSDFEESFFKSLPYWQIPVLLIPKDKKNQKNLKSYLREAESFISHKSYMEAHSRKNTKDKIFNEILNERIDLPSTFNGVEPYQDLDDYQNTLFSFIDEADLGSRERLLNTDIYPLIKILKSKKTTTRKPSTVQRLNGTSFEIFLRAVWISINILAKEFESKPIREHLLKIEIEVLEFKHDLNDSDEDKGESNNLARQLLTGCLGGLQKVFEQMEVRVPQNTEEERLQQTHWNKVIPIQLILDIGNLKCSKSLSPVLRFNVRVFSEDLEKEPISTFFSWSFPSTHPERVLYESIIKIKSIWSNDHLGNISLPVFTLDSNNMAAIYFAADEEEANRLLINALTNITLKDVPQINSEIDPELRQLLRTLLLDYRTWMNVAVDEGIYTANREQLPNFLNNYSKLAKSLLDSKKRGSEALLKQFYKAFFIVDQDIELNDPFLSRAIAWGLTPAVLDLIRAHIVFLANGFSDVIAELAINQDDHIALERLFSLAKIQRPITSLVVEEQKLSADIKSFGFIHYLGMVPKTKDSLAVQSLLRNEEIDDDVDGIVREVMAPSEEQNLVCHVLDDYMDLYPYAQDGLRILAVNITNLSTILSGITLFLEKLLKDTSDEEHPFHCHIRIYSTASSPITTEYRLGLWQNQIVESFQEKNRPLLLSLEHHYLEDLKISDYIDQIKSTYDIAFIFHFLRNSPKAIAEEAKPFEFEFGAWEGMQFPITEYPFPIQKEEPNIRQSLLSNRRLTIQTSHSDLSAQLFFKGSIDKDYLISARVDYKPWKDLIERIHQVSQWVACIDPFIDKKLLCDEDKTGNRKIIGFKSGLGSYGEINLTISTEQDTLKQLTNLVEGKLISLFPFMKNSQKDSESIANRIMHSAEEVIGLASIRAITGVDERIRDVVGFSAIRRILELPSNQLMSQLLPLDSLLHWYSGAKVTMKPDLLNLSLEIRQNDIPLIHATILECKLAQKSHSYIEHAKEQILEGLQHLTQLLSPKHEKSSGIGFDRRYWWSQLHRAITSRSVISLSFEERLLLNQALENIANGHYEIQWKAGIFTFWSNESLASPQINSFKLNPRYVFPPYIIPEDFSIQLTEIGYEDFFSIFKDIESHFKIRISSPPITLRSSESKMNKFDSLDPNQVIEIDRPIAIHNNTSIKKETSSYFSDENISNPPQAAETPPPECLVISSPIPEKILIGLRTNREPVYWHYGHPSLSNRHILIFGSSGSGKTYAIQCLLSEMANQHLHSLIIDYTDGFLPKHLEKVFSQICVPQNHYIIQNPLPINPFEKQKITIDPSIPTIEETPFIVASRVESIFSSIFDLGEQQKAVLIRVITSSLEEEPDLSLEKVLKKLRTEGSSGLTLANKIEPLISNKPFQEGDSSFWDTILTEGKHWSYILQLKGFAQGAQKLITELSLWDLWNYAQKFGSKNHPIPLVLDEIQNLNHKSDSPIDKLMREGRKFGLSLILATQTASQFDQEEKDRLFQAAHKLIFKPASTEIKSFAKILSQISLNISHDEWAQRLAKLDKGQCWSLGPTLKSDGTLKDDVILVNISSLENRFPVSEKCTTSP